MFILKAFCHMDVAAEPTGTKWQESHFAQRRLPNGLGTRMCQVSVLTACLKNPNIAPVHSHLPKMIS